MGKNLLNDESLEVYIAISQKKMRENMQFSVLTRKMTGNGMNQNPVNLQCE